MASRDFKGWFSSLFGWRNSIGNEGILYSPDNLPATHVAVTRILEGMGVVVSKAQGDDRLEYGEILVGRTDYLGPPRTYASESSSGLIRVVRNEVCSCCGLGRLFGTT